MKKKSGIRIILGTFFFFFFSQVKHVLPTLQLSPKLPLEKYGKIFRHYSLLILPILKQVGCHAVRASEKRKVSV